MAEDLGTACLTVRGRFRIAHSFSGKLDIPLHGITYVVDAKFGFCGNGEPATSLAAAEQMLADVLARYDRTNLDCAAGFQNENTTCERIARAVWEGVVAHRPPSLAHLTITVKESDVAYVEYARAVSAGAGVYAVAVRARCMVGRSLRPPTGDGEETCEGATLIVDALFRGEALDPEAGFLFDICLGEQLLNELVAPLHQRHLRDVQHDLLATHETEHLASMLCAQLAQKLAGEAAKPLCSVRIVVRESDLLAAEAECALPLGLGSGLTPNPAATQPSVRALCLTGPYTPLHPAACLLATVRVEARGAGNGHDWFDRRQIERAVDEALDIEAERADVAAPGGAAEACAATSGLAALSRRLWARLATSIIPVAAGAIIATT